MEELRAPGSTVAVFSVTLQMRDSTPADDMKALQKSLSAALGQHCAATADALTASAPAFGIEDGGDLGDSPARGSGVTFVSLRPRVQFRGEGSEAGAEENALEATVFAGGLLFESLVATLAKAGLTFTDFPTFKIDCSSSQSLRCGTASHRTTRFHKSFPLSNSSITPHFCLKSVWGGVDFFRHLLARGPQHLLSALSLKMDISWDVRRRLIRKLLGLTDAASPMSLILGVLPPFHLPPATSFPNTNLSSSFRRVSRIWITPRLAFRFCK
jgi:hypothetical protein